MRPIVTCGVMLGPGWRLPSALSIAESASDLEDPADRDDGGERAGQGAADGGDKQNTCSGAPDRIRTCDLRLRRPTLYPLSYRRADRDHTRGAQIDLRRLQRL
jgi:hypothetical protein